MVTTYPANIDNSTTLPTVLDNITGLHAVTINILRDTAIAIEAALGAKPQGLYTTVAARLAALEGLIQGSISLEVSFSGDISGNSVHQTVIGLQTKPISPTAPTQGQTLIFDGAVYNPSTNFFGANLTTTGTLASGAYSLGAQITFSNISSPGVSASGKAVIYFDTTANKLRVSENGGSYVNLVGADDTITTITTGYTTLVTDEFISVGTLSGTITILLYATPFSGQKLVIKDANGSAFAHNIIIGGNGNNIDGASSIVLDQNFAAITLTFTGTQWSIS